MSTTRLIRIMQWQGVLSVSEAQSAINAHRRGDGRYGGGEAVVHYGGATKLIQDAIHNRSKIFDIYGGR